MQNRQLNHPLPSTKNILLPLFVVVLHFSTTIFAQNKNIQLKEEYLDSLRTPKRDTVFENHTELTSYLKQTGQKLNEQGYINHEIVLTKQNDSSYSYTINYRQKINFVKLEFTHPAELLPDFKANDVVFPFLELHQKLKTLYQYYEKQGYTFTALTPTIKNQRNDTLFTEISIKTTKKRTIDNVVINGYKSFPQKFIKRHLKLNSEETYNKNTLSKTSEEIKDLSFVTETRKPEVLFTKDSTQIYLYLHKHQSNKFDGLVGFTNGENGKLRFNGYLDVSLNNTFNKGEHLAFYWSNNGNEQENFKIKAATPYIFGSSINPEINFEIYKQDSSFINTTLNVSLDYNLNIEHQIGLNFSSKNSTNLLTNNNTTIETFQKKLYGTQYSFKHKRRNKTNIKLNAKVSAGTKKTTATSEGQYYTLLDFSFYEKLSKRSRIYIHNRTENIFGKNLTLNELFQIGGANTIRGFYEQSIFTSSYNFTNFEYQLLTSLESYLYTFTDFAITDNPTTSINDRNYSFGLGYAYKTKGGFINLNYAFGKTNDSPFNLNKGIFHIKLTTEF